MVFYLQVQLELATKMNFNKQNLPGYRKQWQRPIECYTEALASCLIYAKPLRQPFC